MVQSLCKEDATAGQVSIPCVPAAHGEDVKLSHEMLPIAENEILVNEIVHKHQPIALTLVLKDDTRIKVCIW